MKRAGRLWQEIVSSRNLYHAARDASRGKRNSPACLEFGFHREAELAGLEAELREGKYRPGSYREFVIREPKERRISAPPLRDRVVHHALLRVIESHLDRRLIHHTYACRLGKGTHRAVLQCARWTRRFPYVLRCDIRKFFPSVDHEILKAKLRRIFKDRRLLGLLDAIVDGGNAQEPCEWYFPGDDLFTPFERRRGLPIGALTSQWFANLYLNDLDQIVQRHLRPQGYVRYMDDFLLFGDDAHWLGEARRGVQGALDRDRLRLHGDKSVGLRTQRGIPFLGWRVFPDFRLLRSPNKVRARRRMRRMARDYRRGLLSVADVRQSVASWIGHARWGDTWRLRKEIIEGTTFRRRGNRPATAGGWRAGATGRIRES